MYFFSLSSWKKRKVVTTMRTQGKALIWGMGHKGQLGLGTSTLVQSVPALLNSESLWGRSTRVPKLFIGPNHAIAESDSGLRAFGRNDCGQLGVGDHDDRFEPTALQVGQEVGSGVVVGIGSYHTLIATGRKVYGFGRGKRGQTGLGNTEDSSRPTVIPSLSGKAITKIAAGEDFSVVVADRELFTFGNKDKLGYETNSDELSPRKLMTIPDGTIEDLCCGWGHTAMLVRKNDGKSTQSDIYTWGSNKHGQCGLGHKNAVQVPTRLASLGKKSIIRVATGASHTVAVTEDSKVYIWGSHRDGKLGMGDKIDQDILVPEELSFLPQGSKVVDVSCGADHTAVLTGDNQVYLWGFGQHGTLGFPEMQNETKPRALDLTKYLNRQDKVVSIHCGMDVTIALVDTSAQA